MEAKEVCVGAEDRFLGKTVVSASGLLLQKITGSTEVSVLLHYLTGKMGLERS